MFSILKKQKSIRFEKQDKDIDYPDIHTTFNSLLSCVDNINRDLLEKLNNVKFY